MATRDELYSTRFWKAENLKRPMTLQISECNTEKLKSADGVAKDKLVIYFAGETKSLVCNLTNFDAIAELTGESDTDAWPGHKICLFPTTTQLGNKKVACIRVKAPTAPVAAPKKAAAKPAANDGFVDDNEPPPHTEAPPFDDDIDL